MMTRNKNKTILDYLIAYYIIIIGLNLKHDIRKPTTKMLSYRHNAKYLNTE
jgi:hypothetical protein